MIYCRLYVGSGPKNKFAAQGQKQTLYVLDELALKSFYKHRNITGTGSTTASQAAQSEFRNVEGYDEREFLDKFIRPIIIQEHFGMRTVFSADPEDIRNLADNYVVAVQLPDTARSIPVGTTGILMPKPYSGHAPDVTEFGEKVD